MGEIYQQKGDKIKVVRSGRFINYWRYSSCKQGFAPFLQERRVYKNPPYGKPNFAVLVAARCYLQF